MFTYEHIVLYHFKLCTYIYVQGDLKKLHCNL